MPMRTIPGAMRQRWWMESGLDAAAAHLMGEVRITGRAVESRVRAGRLGRGVMETGMSRALVEWMTTRAGCSSANANELEAVDEGRSWDRARGN